MRYRWMLVAALALAARPAAAQGVISQGMSPEQVRSVFGAPATSRAAGEWTYWYYHNGCPNRCGSDDVVFFRENRVVAAVLRTARRRFSGPTANDALEPYDNVSAAGGRTVRPGEEAPVRMRVIRRDRDADEVELDADVDDEGRARAPARVGGVRVAPGDDRPGRGEVDARYRTGDSGGRAVTPPARAGSEAAGRTTIIRAEGEGAAPAPARAAGAVRDSALGPPATAVDDERRAREGRVEPNTVRNSPDTMQADRRERERRVQPRVVPRGNP